MQWQQVSTRNGHLVQFALGQAPVRPSPVADKHNLVHARVEKYASVCWNRIFEVLKCFVQDAQLGQERLESGAEFEESMGEVSKRQVRERAARAVSDEIFVVPMALPHHQTNSLMVFSQLRVIRVKLGTMSRHSLFSGLRRALAVCGAIKADLSRRTCST